MAWPLFNGTECSSWWRRFKSGQIPDVLFPVVQLQCSSHRGLHGALFSLHLCSTEYCARNCGEHFPQRIAQCAQGSILCKEYCACAHCTGLHCVCIIGPLCCWIASLRNPSLEDSTDLYRSFLLLYQSSNHIYIVDQLTNTDILYLCIICLLL